MIEDSSLKLLIVEVAHDHTQPGSLLAHSRARYDERPWEGGWLQSNVTPPATQATVRVKCFIQEHNVPG